jgi:osmoprotectant transport system ATP-binding protein
MAVPALAADGVRKTYGAVAALDGVTLAVAPGECVALVGESGSGKSTLLRAFNGLTTPDAGRVRVRGDEVTAQDAIGLRRHLGYVAQDGGLLPHWTVARNAAMVPWLLGLDDAAARAAAMLGRVGLPVAEYGARWPHELSGGQRQRVAIARALAAGPDVVLLDEPFGALDAITRSDVQAVFRELRSAMGLAALLVTHDLHEAALLADRVAVMRAGRIEQVDTPAGLLAAPATPYVQALLSRARLTREDLA